MENTSIFAVDLEHRFWSVALGGNLKSINAAKDIVISDIRGLAKNYTRVAIAVGVRGDSFRRALWPSYKADRKQRPDHLWSLLADTVKACEAEGWAVLRATEDPDGFFEADDVLATIAAWCCTQGFACDIYTGDSDLAQCVSDPHRLRMLRSYKGIQPLDEAGVLAWLGVKPDMVAPLKMLAGDGGDGYGNIFPGFGEKSAIKALAKHIAPENVIEAARLAVEKLDGKAPAEARILWANGRGPELLSIASRLARVRTDVPVDLDSIMLVREPKPLEHFGGDMLPEMPDSERSGMATPEEVQAILEARAEVAAPEVECEPVVARKDVKAPPASSTALVVRDTSTRLLVSAAEGRERIREFTAYVRHCLTPNVDYGKIPGCGDKPALFKPGAEKLAEVYGFAPTFETVKEIERWGEDGAEPMFYYSYRCKLARKSDGIHVSECIGSCNSRETKYSGRWVKENMVPPHLDVKRLKRREFVSKFGPDKGQTVIQYRTPNEEIFDQVNTLQKMAQKRAFVGAVILATRSGGIFTQDLEDVPASAYGTAGEKSQWDL